MQTPAFPANEKNRLIALKEYGILDTAAQEVFDDYTYLASSICGTPISIITLLDETRQWFKSKIGINASETSRDISFCGHAILQDDIFEIENALTDPRFSDNPLVVDEPHIRFYAGMPISTQEGYHLGTLCVIDTVPRKLTNEQRKALQRLARQVMSQIEHNAALKTILKLNTKLYEKAMFVKNITNQLPALISYWNKNLHCEFANSGFLKVYGKHPDLMIGKPLENVVGEKVFNSILPYAKNVLAGQSQTFELRQYSLTHGFIDCITNYVPNFNTHGEVIGFYALSQNITDIKKIESKLSISSQMLKRTGKMAKIGGWEFVPKTQQIVWSDEVFTIHEIDSGIIPSVEDALAFYLPEGRTVLIQAIEECVHNFTPWSLELPFKTAKGNHIWVRSQGEAYVENGLLSKLFGTFQDITQQKIQEQQIFANEVALRKTLVREVHHRIKNNLQGVSGVLFNAAHKNPQLIEPINAAIGQLQSVAVIHGLQGKNQDSTIELSELTQAITQNIASIWQTNILFSIQNNWSACYLSKNEEVPTALILNELITNAEKHNISKEQVQVFVTQKNVLADNLEVCIKITNTGEFENTTTDTNSNTQHSGLKLVGALMPKNGAYLHFFTKNDTTEVTLMLKSPTILLNVPSAS